MAEPLGGDRAKADPGALARAYFLESNGRYGCAETAFMVLKDAYGLGDPADPSAAMALNGGLAYSGGPCGAITGAALAVGLLAGRRLDDHTEAKRVARELVASTMDAFLEEYSAIDCGALIGYDLRAPGGHEAFIESGAWREGCMRQIEFVVERLAELQDPETWDRAVLEIEASGKGLT